MPIPLRGDFETVELRREARNSKDSGQARRLLALAAIYDGSTRTEAAKIGGVTLQIVRDWVMKFNTHGPSGLIAGNPTENIWEFMRDNWLSNRVFLNADDLLDHCCEAWNKLRSQPWRLMSIGMRDWAHKF